MLKKNCYNVLYFDTAAMEEHHNWTAVFSCYGILG